MQANRRKRASACALHAAINRADEAMATAKSYLADAYEHIFLAAQIDKRRRQSMETAWELLNRIDREPERATEYARAAKGHLRQALYEAAQTQWRWGTGAYTFIGRARKTLGSGLESVKAHVGRCRCKSEVA